MQNIQPTSSVCAAKEENSIKVSSSRKSLSTEEVSTCGPNVLQSYILCLHRCCLHVFPHPFLHVSKKKQEINGPVLRMQLVNAMQWLKQLPRMYFFVLWAGRDHNNCPFALHTKMLGKSMRMIKGYLSNGTEVVPSWHVCIARALLP